MAKACCVPGCKSTWDRKNNKITFHMFPSNLKLFIAWKCAIKRHRLPRLPLVCSLHFHSENFELVNGKPRKLKRNAIPDIKLPKNYITDSQNNIELSNESKEEVIRQNYIPQLDLTDAGVSENGNKENQTLDFRNAESSTLSPVTTEQTTKQLFIEISPLNPNAPKVNPISLESDTRIVSKLVTKRIVKPEPSRTIKLDPAGELTNTNRPQGYRKLTESTTVLKLRRSIQEWRQKVLMTKRKCKKLEAALEKVKEYTKKSEIENIVNGNFGKLRSMVHNEIDDSDFKVSEEVIHFAIAMILISPQAYDYLGKFIELPNKIDVMKEIESGSYVLQLQ